MKNTLMDEARDYLSGYLKGLPVDSIDDASVQAGVGQIYPGGWAAFRESYERAYRTSPARVSAPSPVQQWARLRARIGGHPHDFHLRPHTDVLQVKIGDDVCMAALRIAEFTEGPRRDVVHRYGIKIMTWTRGMYSFGRAKSVIMWEDEAPSEFARWGSVNTPERHEDKMDQYETCYRPGTEKRPMQGPAARLGVTREELHGLDKK